MKSAAISALAYTIMLMAPLPSAYFVAVSAQAHFDSPLSVAVVIAVVIEGLGFICAHVALKYWQWNRHTRIKKIERSWLEFILALCMYAVYFIATIGLLAVLDVMPQLNAWSKVMFPILSAVGVVNLALLFQLESMQGEKKPTKHHVANGNRGNYGNFLAELAKRNGNGMNAIEVQELFSVPQRTAYNWLEKARGQ